MNRDEDHLRLLSIFHYVLAGVIALFATVPVVHLGIGIYLLLGPDQLGDSGGSPPPAWLGWTFIGVATLLIALGWTMAGLTFLAGRFLSQHRRHTFCLVVAGLLCLHMPLGTVLGIFTIVVLMRDSVQRLFETGSSAPSTGRYVPDEGPLAS